MADTTRQKILDKILDLVTDIENIQGAQIDMTTLVDIDSVPMAYCFIYAGPEARAKDGEQVMGYETWTWIILIELWCYIAQTDEIPSIETMLGRIHKTLYDNYTLDGNAIDIRRVGADQKYFDLDGTRKAMVIPFEVKYRHVQGVM